MKKLLLFLFSILIPFAIYAQDTVDIDQSKKQIANNIKQLAYENISAYGSYRINFGVNNDGYIGMADNSSRFGLKGQMPLNAQLNAIAGIEIGARLVALDETIVFRGDPGYEVGQGNSTLFGRLGFVGFSHKYVSFTVGKQWSAYYDVAAYTDMLFAFGAEASGTFNNDSDGGVSGTGRANHLFLLRTGTKHWKLALQTQARSITDNSMRIGDTYGGSIQYVSDIGLNIGFAANIVNDGVENPIPNQPKIDDKAYVGSIAYKSGKWYTALLFAKSFQHESASLNDTTKMFYDANGIEAFVSYSFGQQTKWRAALAMNMLWPDEGQKIDEYRMLYFVAEFSYIFGKESSVFITIKQDIPREISGYVKYETIFAMGLRSSFGY